MGRLRVKWAAWWKQIKTKNGLTKDPNWVRWVTRWILLSLALHLVSVASSTGFYQVDEHFQVVEPLSIHLNKSSLSDLPVEFQNRTAPWTQTWLYYQVVRFAGALGVENPLQWSLGFRLFSALISWLTQVLLILCLAKWEADKTLRKMTTVGFVLFWALPAFHARHSSANLGGALFFGSLAFFSLSQNPRPAFWVWAITGAAMGLSTQIHPALVFAVFGFLVWVLGGEAEKFPTFWKRQENRQGVLAWSSGLAFACLLGFFADSWGYGQWTWSAWNRLASLPSSFDTWRVTAPLIPLWNSLSQGWPIWGVASYILLVSGPFIVNVRILSWTSLPLVIWAHIKPENQVADLSPLLHIAPFFLTPAAMALISRYHLTEAKTRKLLRSKIHRRVAIGLGTWYAISFFTLTLAPAWTPSAFFSKLYALRGYALNIHYLSGEGPFETLGMAMHFYRPENVIGTRVDSPTEFQSKLQDTQTVGWFFYRHATLPAKMGDLPNWCKLEISTLPPLFEIPRRALMPHSQNWSLYQCKAPEQSIATREGWDTGARRPASVAPTAPHVSKKTSVDPKSSADTALPVPQKPVIPEKLVPQPPHDTGPESFEDPEFSDGITPTLSRSST